MEQHAKEPHQPRERPLSTLLKDLSLGALELIRSEARLAKVQALNDAHDLGRLTTQAIVFFAVALIGALLIAAWAVISLGNALGKRYDLAALIIGLGFLVPGVFFSQKTLLAIKRTLWKNKLS